MSDDTANPYAPPSHEVVSSDVVGGMWRVEGDYLVVREGTVLPEVDLDGHGKGGPLTPMAMKLPVPLDGKGVGLIVLSALPMVAYIIYQLTRGQRISWLWMMGIWFVTHFLTRGIKIRTAPTHIYGYISVPAIREITRRDRLRQRLTVALLVPIGVIFPLVIAYPLMTKRYDRIMDAAKMAGGVVGVTLLLLLGVAIWKMVDKRWHCSRLSDGWLWIKGLGPGALAGLGARSVGYVPVAVKKQVFQARLDLMPEEFWKRTYGSGLGGRFKLWALRRRTKGGPIEHPAFHWSERTWLSPAEADAELLAAWRSEVAGTPLAGWSLVYAERIDTTSGCDQILELVFLSPDRLHAVIPSITRMVVDRKLKEIRGLNFRSFTRDGRIIATETKALTYLRPAELDVAVVKGTPAEVAETHLRRAACETLLPLGAAELRQQEEREMRLNHDVMVAAGIYGPTEEIDFYRP
ncbi:MAG TPA: hypothetical protein VGE67_19330 [Haloferula sp.]